MLSLNLALERLDKISKYFVLNSQKDLIFRDAYTFIMETVYHSVKSKITNLDAVSDGGQLIEMKAPFNFMPIVEQGVSLFWITIIQSLPKTRSR
ncbi:Uncharacterised protein [Enterobacter hormaechei]|uniref:hypothetical protein n=1 Tax=Enterobacter hormaechei TaxID=158836 RepID=UPI000DFE72CA|nr:hypothetical protein [Enterobacter hormaechei]STP56004.1 Uncharacterised protein [Enterobacter hormaechei]